MTDVLYAGVKELPEAVIYQAVLLIMVVLQCLEAEQVMKEVELAQVELPQQLSKVQEKLIFTEEVAQIA